MPAMRKRPAAAATAKAASVGHHSRGGTKSSGRYRPGSRAGRTDGRTMRVGYNSQLRWVGEGGAALGNILISKRREISFCWILRMTKAAADALKADHTKMEAERRAVSQEIKRMREEWEQEVATFNEEVANLKRELRQARGEHWQLVHDFNQNCSNYDRLVAAVREAGVYDEVASIMDRPESS